jgi:Mrp family chromosome partitioning ATPase
LLAAKVASTAVGGGSRSVLVAGPGAGHSTHWPATNLAVALARHGHRVLLVLGPGLPFPPGSGHPPGAGGRGPIPAAEAFRHARPVGDVPRLGVIGIDEVEPDNSRLPWSTLLRRPAPAARGDQADRADHADHDDHGPDFVLVEASDGPELAEILALAQHADALVLVAEQGRTDRGDVAGWATALRQVDANLVGGVLLVRRRGRGGREPASATATRPAGHPLPSQPPTHGESEHRDQSFQPKSRPSQENSSALRGR